MDYALANILLSIGGTACYSPSMTTNEIVKALLKSGLTQEQIADESGLSQTTISRLYTGKQQDTNLSDGMRLIALYERSCRKKRIA